MSETLFSLSSLAIVTPIVALSTYIIVLNLDTITQLFSPLGTSRTEYASLSLLQYFLDYQIRSMQRDESMVWRDRGTAFDRVKVLGSNSGTPSYWWILHFVMRKVVLMVSRVLSALVSLMPYAIMKWRRQQAARPEDAFMPASLGHLGDVRVQVQVAVDIEAAQEILKSD